MLLCKQGQHVIVRRKLISKLNCDSTTQFQKYFNWLIDITVQLFHCLWDWQDKMIKWSFAPIKLVKLYLVVSWLVCSNTNYAPKIAHVLKVGCTIQFLNQFIWPLLRILLKFIMLAYIFVSFSACIEYSCVFIAINSCCV